LHATETNPEEVLGRGTPSGSRADENDGARQTVVRLANVCGNAAEGAILRRRPALPTMRGDHLDAIALGQISIQAVAVIRLCHQSIAPGG
jgi:hypothetical protein